MTAATWTRSDLPGICVRCDRVYLTGAWVTADPLGGDRGRCCAWEAGAMRLRTTLRQAIRDPHLGAAARMEVA